MAICPHCGGMAVLEEYTRIQDEQQTRVRIRRCVSLGRERSRKQRKKDTNLRSSRLCGEVEVLLEDTPLSA